MNKQIHRHRQQKGGYQRGSKQGKDDKSGGGQVYGDGRRVDCLW